MVLSQEQAQVDLHVKAYQRVRLVRYVTTEQVTQTVEVRREEVRVETVDTDTESSSLSQPSVTGKPFDQSDLELVLHEERVVVNTEVVPVERVRLRVVTTTDSRSVSTDLQRENVDVVTMDARP